MECTTHAEHRITENTHTHTHTHTHTLKKGEEGHRHKVSIFTPYVQFIKSEEGRGCGRGSGYEGG